ncbi:molybdopterin synthase catalytic subunit MoaE [Candidatus Pantoea edessiphila]|uniref:Molybdopterin synthase catalytic subunit n=1 Tax=Candidatus Pantoea edessiphila TaxID=2044610 RepID=A0A2P5SX60_9GAMM|nr:molybdopterin synthase catalytic subunit MoaE [Candidatus Pantoea edessiphila]PPI86892.1 molybdopterin synthase catalytic subunit MoaE [Candidatus Pantoea edessiphila]
MKSKINIIQKPLDLHQEYFWLNNCTESGAIVTFTGKVRNYNLGDLVTGLTLEYYSGMTEKFLQQIIQEASNRWFLERVNITHRFGKLNPGNEIIFVGVTSVHRTEAFAAIEYLVDYIKTYALFWKCEKTNFGYRWIEVNASDNDALIHWN